MPEALNRLLEEHSEALLQFAGYFIVSACALCVDVAVYWSFLGVVDFAFVAAAAGYVCGVLVHYALSSRVVFRKRLTKRGVMVEAPTLAKFFAAGFFGLIVTAAVVGLLADVLGLHPLFAKFAAAGCSFIVVFLSLRMFVFSLPAQTTAKPA